MIASHSPNHDCGCRVGAAAWLLALSLLVAPPGGAYGQTVTLVPTNAIWRFDVTRTVLPVLSGPGALDPTFALRLRGHNDWPGTVSALAEQPDGRLWIGGWFTQVNGVPRRNLARLHPDGALDVACPADVDGTVSCLALQPDGGLLVGGEFTEVNGVPRRSLARLHPDGSVDTAFDPVGSTSNQVLIGALLLQADGKIVIGGWFTNLNASGRSVLARLHPDGRVDASFNAGDIRLAGLDHDPIRELVREPGGKIVAAGELDEVNGFLVPGVARFNPDGSLDSTFWPSGVGHPRTLHALALQPDGKILVGGWENHTVYRLQPNGALDGGTFRLSESCHPSPFVLSVQPDGKILVGGDTADWLSCRLQRLLPEGSVDPTFDPGTGPNDFVNVLRSAGDGKLWIAGGFTSFNGFPAEGVARLQLGPMGPFIVRQPASQTRFVGQAATFTVEATGTPPFAYQWLLNGTPILDATHSLFTSGHSALTDAGDYSVVVSNIAGTATSATAALTVLSAPTGPGSVDFSFDLTDGGRVLGMAGGDTGDAEWGYGATVNALAPLPDGRIFVAGDFAGVNGVPNLNYARLNADGRVDRSLDASWGTDGEIVSVAREADGAMLILGRFSLVNAVPCSQLARIRPDGTADAAFRPTFLFREDWRLMNQVLVQPDGRILVCGAFTNVNGVARSSVARLNADGTLDGSFAVPLISSAQQLVLLPDGRILVHGVFPALNQPVIRLHPDGSHDPTFNLSRPPGTSSFVVFSIAAQPDGKVLAGYGYEENVARFNADGSYDPTFQPGHWVNGLILHLLVQADGKILVGGEFQTLLGPTQYSVARLNADGTLDETFNAGDAAGPPHWWWDCPKVRALALQPDGRLLVGTAAEGSQAVRYAVVRLLSNGARDPDFNPEVNPGHVAPYAMTPLADGKILINGSFVIVNGVRQPALARLHSDGRIDPTFTPRIESIYGYAGAVSHTVVQPDGRILIGGYFTNVNGVDVSDLARLQADGTLDTSFSTAIEHGYLTALALQADGRILIGGSFAAVAGVPRHHLARLHPDGTLDASFVPAELVIGDDWWITAIGFQSDGQIVVAGHLVTDPTWSEYYGLTRLNADGTLDAAFHERARANGAVFKLLIQPDDKIVFSGGFSRVNGVPMPALARLNADGTLDTSFQPPSYEYPDVLALAPDGKLCISGGHQTVRLYPNGSVDPRWHCDTPGGVTVLANGDVLFGGSFYSVNGVPVYGMARLRGDLETVPPATSLPVTHQTRFAGQSVTLRVDACGTGTLEYQWLLNGAPIPCATLSSFVIGHSSVADAGVYTVIVSNAAGSVTSDPITVTVLPVPTGPGSLDLSFDPTAGGEKVGLEGHNAVVSALALQPDGKVVVGGSFLGFDDVPRRNIARLHADGRVDRTFDTPGGTDGSVTAIALQADGRILIAGRFQWVAGVRRLNLARLHADGSLDETFAPQLPDDSSCGLGAVVVIQPDGKILWNRCSFQEQPAGLSSLVRLHPDGSLDAAFHPATDGATSVALHPDGKILVGRRTQADDQMLMRLNPDGSRDPSFTAYLSRPVPESLPGVDTLVLQPDGKVLMQGLFVAANADGSETRRNFARLNSDGSVDSTFHGPATGFRMRLLQPDGEVLGINSCAFVTDGRCRSTLERLHPDGSPASTAALDEEVASTCTGVSAMVLRPDGGLLVGRNFSTCYPEKRSLVACLQPNGDLDLTFRSRVNLLGAWIAALLPQPDGTVVVGGQFTRVNGVARPAVARLNADGTLDRNFNPVFGQSSQIAALAQQADGKILIGGAFDLTGSSDWSDYDKLARLNADGSLDATFQLDIELRGNAVYAIAVQPDGKIVAGGKFDLADEPYCCLARFLPDGRLDPSFTPGVGPTDVDTGIRALALQSDGKILVGGESLTYHGVPRGGLVRLQSDGTLDATFHEETVSSLGWVIDILVQPDGKILASGEPWYACVPARPLMRLNSDGTLDASFNASALGFIRVEALAWQPDGKVIVGRLSDYGTPELMNANLVRLNADGSWDRTFASDVNHTVKVVAVLPDGRLLIGGWFNAVNGLPCEGLARLNNDVRLSFVRREIEGFTVRLVAAPAPATSAYAVEDHPPDGWDVTNISHGGVFDAATGKVKFGPFYDANPRTLAYEALPPLGAQGVFTFTGSASADGVNTPIGGDQHRLLVNWHPAECRDARPPNWRMEIEEVTAYGAAWRQGVHWIVPPYIIPMDYVTRAAFLWRGGECYEVDPVATNAPLCWVNCASPISNLKSQIPAHLPAAGRRLPHGFVPGEPFTVRVSVWPGAGQAYAVEEQFPAGWTIASIHDGGEADPGSGKIKWGPFLDGRERTLSYQMLPPPNAGAAVAFRGTASFDGVSVEVSGDSSSTAGCRLAIERHDGAGQLGVRAYGGAEAFFGLWVSQDLRTWMPLSLLVTNGQSLKYSPATNAVIPPTFFQVRPIP